ncbi:MAG: serine hydrolase [Desulfuromonadales bacterium]
MRLRTFSGSDRFSVVIHLWLILFVAVLPAHAFAAVFPAAHWGKVSTPEAAGWSATLLKAADEYARTLQTDAFLIVDSGVIVHEYGAVNRTMNVHSVRKSILAVLMGIYADRGMIDISKTLADLNINDKSNLSTAERQATVRQLLQARSGIYHPAAYETPGMKAARPSRGVFQPGEHWYYNNWDFNALGTIFRKFSGRTVFEALNTDLAKPLQFEDFKPASDTRFLYESTSEHPAYIMRLSARDLARVGLLMAHSGTWGDIRMLSQKWVDESSTSYSNASPGTGYGYLWWVGLDGWHFRQRFPGKVFSARGNHGQYMVVDPVRDLVIVHLVDNTKENHRSVSSKQFGELLKLILNAGNFANKQSAYLHNKSQSLEKR